MKAMSVMIGAIIVLNLFYLVNGQPDICSKMPSIIDHCPQASNRWYYNVERDRCKKFKRGTCTVEENQFLSRAACRNVCMVQRTFRTNRHLAPAMPPVVSWKEVCLTEMKSEDCRSDTKSKPLWFFNSSSGVCEQCAFVGKPGFKNKFADLTECKWACINISAEWSISNCYECDSPTSYCTIDESSTFRTCHCRRGFNRRSGSSKCQDVDECDQALFNLCHENGECVNTIGSYYCRCKENFIGDGKTYCHSMVTAGPHQTTTVAKQECENRGHPCATEAICLHVGDNYFCQCPDGYRGNGTYCLPNTTLPETAAFRQCLLNGLICHSFALCFHFGPKYFCQCAGGYFGNGTFCSPVPKQDPILIDNLYCQRNYKFCSPDAQCYHQSPSNYSCKCKLGFAGDGFYCTKLKESIKVFITQTGADVCQQSGIACSKHASCKNASGSYFCECSYGFAGNGVLCTADPGSCWDPFDKRYTHQCGSYSFQKWFYFDQDKRMCKMFWFGKCFENIYSRNIFSHEQSCNRLCHYNSIDNSTVTSAQPSWDKYPQKVKSYPVATTSRLSRIHTTTEISTHQTHKVYGTKLPKECLQPCQSGTCSSTMVMYFYNGYSGSCQPFMYSGCGGNSNRFYSLAFCETACLSPYLKDVEEICLLPLSAGYGKGDKRCELASRILYYYNPYSSDCQEFYYYGCGGNENRFSSHAECKIRCMRKIPTSVAILEKRNLRDCYLSMDEGRCEYIPNAPRIRYFYDSDIRQCSPFNFNGCGGNENRFGEKEVCENICGGLFKPKSKLCIGWPDAGQCNDINVKWYFNMKNGLCQEFSWTGCAGNTNRFSTKIQCEQVCLEGKKIS